MGKKKYLNSNKLILMFRVSIKTKDKNRKFYEIS